MDFQSVSSYILTICHLCQHCQSFTSVMTPVKARYHRRHKLHYRYVHRHLIDYTSVVTYSVYLRHNHRRSPYSWREIGERVCGGGGGVVVVVVVVVVGSCAVVLVSTLFVNARVVTTKQEVTCEGRSQSERLLVAAAASNSITLRDGDADSTPLIVYFRCPPPSMNYVTPPPAMHPSEVFLTDKYPSSLTL
ncbi:hypothetical protein C0Q70_17159 [Pomacea canaliculata]|uniref:Uncharacterized protein n=1 Tax=Pomacea canaliculata TaxID=400727 RepID=A0A2T7NRT1_POMCA|nr:hypothetical protein C0Q70_17159 [Pomacea canaliculata]